MRTTILSNFFPHVSVTFPEDSPAKKTSLVAQLKALFTKDPINIATGEAYFSSTDFSLSARGPKLALFRQYRSLSTFSGMFGFGWRTDFDVNLTEDASGNVLIYDEEGTASYFTNNSGTYTPSPGNFSTIVKNPDNTFTVTDKNGNVTHYGTDGRLSSRTDRNGNTLSFVYNPAVAGGTYIQDASGRQIKLYFDPNGRITSAQDPAGHSFQYGYDLNGNLVSITAPTGAVTNYSYDANHKIVQSTNPNGHKTYFEYDAQGRAFTNYQDNNVNKINLNFQANNTTVTTDSLGHQNTYVFNDFGLLLSHTDPLGAVTGQTWDANMNKTSVTDARGNVTHFAYDAKGNLTQKTDALNRQTTMAYTPDFNLVASITDALGQVTGFVYDVKGNLTTVTDALGKNHTFAYDTFGNVVTATDTLGHSTSFTYDAASHVLQKTDALGNKTTFTYDAAGNILTRKDALNHITGFQYDPLNRLLKTTFADGSNVSGAYDAFGNQVNVTDQRGNTLTKTYDAFERLVKTTDPLGGITQFSYDTQGRLLVLTDANGNSTTYTYDANGKVLTQTNALGFTTSFTYDAVGNVATRTDANAKTTLYSYDALNRLTATNYADGTQVANSYDALDRKTSMTESRGQTLFTYDALSRLLSRKDPGTSSTITYTYDSEGRRLTSVDQNNRTITNTYDALGRLTSVKDANGTTTYTYDAVSNRTSVKTPNGVTESYTFDALNRVLSAVNKKGNEVISSFTNVYDAAGMVIKKTFDEGAFMTYGYDALNRLTKETKKAKNGGLIYDYSYAYDALGNRLSWNKSMALGDFFDGDECKRWPKLLFAMEHVGLRNFNRTHQPVLSLLRTYQYDSNNRLTEWNYALKVNNLTFPIEKTTYAYDKNGNRTSKEKVKRWQEGAPQQTGYSYDLENRLTKLQYVHIPGIHGPQQDTLSYSGDGLRTKAIRNTDTTAYLYDGSNVLVERDASGATTKSYTRGLDFGGGIGSLIAQNTPSSRRNRHEGNDKDILYYQYNDLGSVSNLTTSKGKSAQEYQYDAFGNLLNAPDKDDRDDHWDRDDRRDEDDIDNTYLFSTKEFDQRAGFYYFGARYYDPEVGRWLTPDPLGMVDGPNVYAYVNNNPVNMVDPYGLSKSILTGNDSTHAEILSWEKVNNDLGLVGLILMISPATRPAGVTIVAITGAIGIGLGVADGIVTNNPGKIGLSIGEEIVNQGIGKGALKLMNLPQVSINWGARRYASTETGRFVETILGGNSIGIQTSTSSITGSVFTAISNVNEDRDNHDK